MTVKNQKYQILLISDGGCHLDLHQHPNNVTHADAKV